MGQISFKQRIYTGIWMLGICLPVTAGQYTTALTDASWQVTQSAFECKITREVPRYGQIEIIQKAGEQPTLQLKTPLASESKGIIKLYRDPAPWQNAQPKLSRKKLGTTPLHLGQTVGVLSSTLTEEVIYTLKAGQMATFELKRDTHIKQDTHPLDVVQLTSVGFDAAYQQFSSCLTALLPVSFQDVQSARLLFPGRTYELSADAQTWLNYVIAYVKAPDQAAPVKMIQLEGFTDEEGSYAENRLLSLKRVWAAKDYLVYNGIPAQMIRIRGMASRYPVGDNATISGRVQNNRVDVQLIREPYDSPQYLYPQ